MKQNINNINIEFFDTSFWIGENNLSEKFTILDNEVEPILKKHASIFNIKTTILTNFYGLFCNPFIGNDILANTLKELKHSKLMQGINVWGAMFLEYEMISGIVDLKDFENRVKKRYLEGFRLIRLMPRTHKYPFEATMLKKIYKVLAYYKFPVVISLDEIDITNDKQIEWTKLLEIAEKFEELPIIIDGGNSKELMYNNYIFILLLNSNNIYFNIHNLFGLNQIEDIVKMGGENRLIFDSYYPFYEPFITINRILEADLFLHQIKKIANQNFKTILSKIGIS